MTWNERVGNEESKLNAASNCYSLSITLWSRTNAIEFPTEINVQIIVNHLNDFTGDDFSIWIAQLCGNRNEIENVILHNMCSCSMHWAMVHRTYVYEFRFSQ